MGENRLCAKLGALAEMLEPRGNLGASRKSWSLAPIPGSQLGNTSPNQCPVREPLLISKTTESAVVSTRQIGLDLITTHDLKASR